MTERDIIVDPIITHNNYLIEVAPDEFVNVTQLWKECKQIVKDKKDLQNRIDKAFQLLQLLHYNFPDFDNMHERIEEIQKILKESGE